MSFGVSLSALGLRTPDRLCPDGEPHELPTGVLRRAIADGVAQDRCQRCRELVRVERVGGGDE